MEILTPDPRAPTLVSASCRIAPGIHLLPHGISIVADGITLDGSGSTIMGDGSRAAIRVHGRRDVAIVNHTLRDFRHGLHADDCVGLTISGNQVRATAEVPANTSFLDIWKPADDAYGAAILLSRVRDSAIQHNDLQHQMNGLLTYGCAGLSVQANNASYCSGFGFHLNSTSDSIYQNNHADYCCRYEPRGPRAGHLGADAAGFLIVQNSCRNTFRGNFARLGGDGFFLAGLTPAFQHAPCDNNLFEDNDASHSPNIAFEATFSAGNVFRNNRADYSNFGFWLGYSRHNLLESNRMLMNRQAGIAVEHGVQMQVMRNEFIGNGHGMLLWTKPHKPFLDLFPMLASCSDWRIEANTFSANNTGIKIAADMDHGIRPTDPPPPPESACRPTNYHILRNHFIGSRVAVELIRTQSVSLIDNTFSASAEAHLRESDCRDTIRRPNLGMAGAYAP